MDFSGSFGVAGGDFFGFTPLESGGAAVIVLGIVAEADSAITIKAVKRRTLGIVTDSHSAFALGKRKRRVLGLPTSTNSARPLQARPIGLAIESEIAIPITARKKRSLGQIPVSTSLAVAIVLAATPAPGGQIPQEPTPGEPVDDAWGTLLGKDVAWSAVRDPSTRTDLRVKKEDAVKLIHTRLGMADGLDTVISTELSLQQLILEGAPLLPYFLQAIMEANIATDGPTRLPDGFLREVDEIGFWIQETPESCWKQLIKADYEDIVGCDSQVPTHYAIVGRLIHFAPKPLIAHKVRLGAYMRDEAPNTGFENEWLRHYPDLLIGEAGYAVASSIKDMVAAAYFDGMRKEARGRMMIDITAWDEAGRIRNISDA